ncbi:MAG: hypothetical protein QXK71_07850 [Pyrobaculum sp.]
MIEVVAIVPVEVGICKTCDQVANVFKIKMREELPYGAGDLEALLQALSKAGPHPVRFASPFTLRGLFLMIKYRTGKLPLVIANGKLVHSGPVKDPDELLKKLRAALEIG